MTSADENILLQWDLHDSDQTTTIKSLWKNGDFLDVTIACDDDQIDAHKVILSSASEIFQKILKRSQSGHPFLYLRGISSQELRALLDYIYTGQATLLEEKLGTFQVKGLTGVLPGNSRGKFENYGQNLDEHRSVNKIRMNNEEQLLKVEAIKNEKVVGSTLDIVLEEDTENSSVDNQFENSGNISCAC